MAYLVQNGFVIECVEPEGKWVYEVLPALVSVDKQVIIADGVDTATVTAQVQDGVDYIIFYNAETDEIITTSPVDPNTNTATMEVNMTTPGILIIRAGEKTLTRWNEVIIYSVETL